MQRKQFFCAYRDKKSERAVKSAADTDYRTFRAGVHEAFYERLRLKGKNEFHSPVLFLSFGHERRFRVRSRKFGFGKRDIRFENTVRIGGFDVRSVFRALVFKQRDVYFRCGNAVIEQLALGEDFAVFRNNIVPGKDHIRRAFPRAGVRVKIRAEKFCRLHGYKRTAVIRFSDEFVTRGKIDYDVSARLRV